MSMSALRLAVASFVVVVFTQTAVAQSSNDRGGLVNACCFSDGTCNELTEAECLSQGGEFQGEGYFCQAVRGTAPAQCIPVGGCCFADGTCQDDMTQEACESQNGAFWYGAGTSCADLDCLSFALGACCLPDGSCSSSEDMAFCEGELGGVWQGPETLCGKSQCPSDGPINDDCENAIPLSTSDGQVSGSSYQATIDENVPVECFITREGLLPAGVWYKVIGTGNFLIVDICVDEDYRGPDSGTSVFAAVLCGECDDLNCVGSNFTDVRPCIQSQDETGGVLEWCSEAGREYYILVDLTGDVDRSSLGEDFRIQLIDSGINSCDPLPCGINDACHDAIEISADDVVDGSTLGATLSTVPFCAAPALAGGNTVDLWYTLIGTGNTIEATLCDPSDEQFFDASLTVYCGDCANLQCVTTDTGQAGECEPFIRHGATPAGGSLDVDWCAEAGRRYFIRVAIEDTISKGGISDVAFRLRTLSYGKGCEPLPCGVEPADHCGDAQDVCPGETYVGDNFEATSDYIDHGGPFETIFFCGIQFGIYDVWYRYTPAEDGLLFVHVEGPPTDYVFGIYDECEGYAYHQLACNVARHHGVLVYMVEAYQTYYIRIAGTYFSRGEFEMDLVGPPCANDLPYSNLTD